MRLPDLSAYQAAVQNPSTAFADPDLRAATVARGRLGLPRAVAGNFAVTYQLRSGNRQWAVRCFHRDAADRARRYAAISRTLSGLRSRMLVDITYLDTGVRVGQTWLPITKMPWLDGQSLNRAVEARLSDPKQLAHLERRFVDLVAELRTLGIAHGDLQHGNILVDRAGGLVLVDYDGMFVPALRGLAASEAGDANYQHPRRTTQFDAELDRFAAIVIVVALRALSAAPLLWRTYNTDDNLLFQRADFATPGRSRLFRDLLSEPATHDLAARLIDVCQGHFGQIPRLEDFLEAVPVGAAPLLVKPTQVAALNRLFGTPRPASRRRRAARTATGPRSWKLRRAAPQAAVAFSSDGRLLVTADADARVTVREAGSGRTSQTLHLPRLAGLIGAVALDRHGQVVAAAMHGSSISIWDVTDGSWKRELLLTRGEVRSVALSADARFLAAATDDGTLRCWSLADGSLQGVATGAGVASLAVSLDGRRMVSSGAPAGDRRMMSSGPFAVDRRMAAAGAHRGVRLWELPSGRALGGVASGGVVSHVAVSGALVAGLQPGGRLGVWDSATGAAQHQVELGAAPVRCLALAPDGQRIALVAEDGLIAVRTLTARGRAAQPARPLVSEPTRLRTPDWLRDVLRRVATAVP